MSRQEQEKPNPIIPSILQELLKKRKEEGKGINISERDCPFAKQENKIKQIKLDALMLQQIIRKNPNII